MCVEEAITALKQEICFIVFTFCDNSKFVVCTTLDADILEAFKVDRKSVVYGKSVG